jgi:hypothetical protein
MSKPKPEPQPTLPSMKQDALAQAAYQDLCDAARLDGAPDGIIVKTDPASQYEAIMALAALIDPDDGARYFSDDDIRSALGLSLPMFANILNVGKMSPLMRLGIQMGNIKSGVALRLCKLNGDLAKAEKVLCETGRVTGEDIDGFRQATRQDAASQLAGLFEENPLDEIGSAFAALVKRYHAGVTVEQFDQLFANAILEHHPGARVDDGDDGDVIGQILAAGEPDESEIAPALEWLNDIELQPA